MAYNYVRVQKKADKLIRKYGRVGVLRRSSGDRTVRVVLINYTTRERMGSLIQQDDLRALISANGLTVSPDFDKDKLVVGAGRSFSSPYTTYDIVAPPAKLDPAGIVVYWDLQVRTHG